MDYGDGKLDGIYQFNSKYRQEQVCQKLGSVVNSCKGDRFEPMGDATPAPPPPPSPPAGPAPTPGKAPVPPPPAAPTPPTLPPAEMFWKLKDDLSGVTVASGGGLVGAGTVRAHAQCLGSGSYTFTIFGLEGVQYSVTLNDKEVASGEVGEELETLSINACT